MAKQMSPQLAQEVLAFQQNHPNYDLSRSGVTGFGQVFQNGLGDPQATADFLKLKQDLANEGYHLGATGNPEQNMAVWKQIVLGASTVLGPAVAYAALGGGVAANNGNQGGSNNNNNNNDNLPSRQTVPPGGGTTPGGQPSTDFNAGTTTNPIVGNSPNILDFLKKYGADIGGVLTNAAAADRAGSLEAAGQNARAIAENNLAKEKAAEFNLALPSVRANQVSRGEILNTMQNAPLTGDPRIDKFSGGGLRPSAFGPQARQAGALEASTALNALQNPSTDRLTPQEIPPYNGSTLSNVLGGAGLGADIFSLLSKYGHSNTGNQSASNQTGAPVYDADGNVIGYGG